MGGISAQTYPNQHQVVLVLSAYQFSLLVRRQYYFSAKRYRERQYIAA